MSAPNDPPSEVQLRQRIDFAVLWQARMKARQARLAEAEVDARRALLSRLKDMGKYNTLTPHFVMGLADILVEQGRYAEAEQLARVAVDPTQTFDAWMSPLKVLRCSDHSRGAHRCGGTSLR